MLFEGIEGDNYPKNTSKNIKAVQKQEYVITRIKVL